MTDVTESNMLITNEMHNSYNEFLLLHSTLCRAPDDERLDSFETCTAKTVE